MSQLRQRQAELTALNIEPVLVTFSTAASARQHVKERRLEWPVLVDERRELYRAYGMDRASAWQVWGPATLRAYAREILRGTLPRRSHEDVRQRGGDVLIDPHGIVRLHHVGKGPADRPSIETILEVARAHAD